MRVKNLIDYHSWVIDIRSMSWTDFYPLYPEVIKSKPKNFLIFSIFWKFFFFQKLKKVQETSNQNVYDFLEFHIQSYYHHPRHILIFGFSPPNAHRLGFFRLNAKSERVASDMNKTVLSFFQYFEDVYQTRLSQANSWREISLK